MTSTLAARPRYAAGVDRSPSLVMSDGTELSWTELFDEFAPAIAAYARSRGVRDTDDLVQDVFAAGVARLPQFEGDRSALRSFLFTIAYRRIADEHRRRYRRPETLVADHEPTPDPALSVEEVIDLDDRANQAMAALEVLTQRERSVLCMRILEGATPAEVGEVLGLSSGNVRVIQARALVKVRHYLRAAKDERASALALIGAPLELIRYLRTEMGAGDALRHWMAEVRTSAPPEPASAAPIKSVPAAIAEPASHTASTILSSMIGSGAGRIGAIVSVVALAAAATGPVLIGDPNESTPSSQSVPFVEVAEQGQRDPVPVAEVASADLPIAEVTDPIEPPPHPSIEMPLPETETELVREGEKIAAVTESASPILDDDVVEPLVDDVVEPLVDDTVDLVEETVDTAVTDVVDPLVEEVVDPLVEDTVDSVDPLVEDTVEVVENVVDPVIEDPLVGDLDEAVDGTVPGLGGLLP